MPHKNLDDYKIPCPICGRLMTRSARMCARCRFGRMENHPAWVGVVSTAPETTGHQRCQRIYPEPKTCEVGNCDKKGVHRHHIDGNPMNNSHENVAWLCASHHLMVHKRGIQFSSGMLLSSQTPRPAIVCAECGKVFIQPSPRKAKFCSLSCYRRFRVRVGPLQRGRALKPGDHLIVEKGESSAGSFASTEV
jgi:hypothetical protein